MTNNTQTPMTDAIGRKYLTKPPSDAETIDLISLSDRLERDRADLIAMLADVRSEFDGRMAPAMANRIDELLSRVQT